ncbi:hypothetical protein N9934_02180 [Desulfosarcina sp.]|nr:hypothetical protein [Desulfosarcina sp.]
MKEKRKILVVAPYALWTPHLETDLEIIQNHIDKGDDVTVLTCNASMLTCDPNPDHDFNKCLKCIGRMKSGLERLSKRVTIRSILNLSDSDKDEVKSVNKEYKNSEKLKSAYVDNFDVGWAVFSSLVSRLRDPYPDVSERNNKLAVRSLLQNSTAVYRSIRSYIQVEKYNIVYVFNGRFANLRAVFRAAQAEGVKCFIHDRGCDFNHYELHDDSLPHDMKRRVGRIQAAWKLANPTDVQEIASKFYQERSESIKQNWISHTEDQDKGSLPDSWDLEKENIVIYTSSEDEFVSIGDEWKSDLYANQSHALKKIASELLPDKNIQLYVRMHPNLKGVNNSDIHDALEIQIDNLVVIPPDSPVDSYTLLKKADKVLTFGSTMGIEAVFWGIPSILAGVSLYKNLGGTYNPSTHKEVVSLLRQPNLPKKAKEAALIYGYYQKTRGIRFNYFQGTDVWDGYFKGVRIEPSFLFRILKNNLVIFNGILRKISLRVNKYRMGID